MNMQLLIRKFPAVLAESSSGLVTHPDYAAPLCWPDGGLLLIRHASTPANERREYCGRSDDSLSESGRLEALQTLSLLQDQIPGQARDSIFASRSSSRVPPLVLTSPLRRCRETAALLWPDVVPEIVEGFAETDFGDWDGKTWENLKDDSNYQRWLNEGFGSKTAPPGGESSYQAMLRIGQAWRTLFYHLQRDDKTHGQAVSIVTHGGVIMNLMAQLTQRPDSFYQWQCRPCEGFWLGTAKNLVETRPDAGDEIVQAEEYT